MTAASGGRPLVTFALFAYNQERYIREAVEGAFSQTYRPLEIILSDDCSTDRTFEIMQEMAEAYDGPHNVRVVKTPGNLGVASHVLLRGREASGEIVVVAAGDDVSKPERTNEHVPLYADEDVMGVSGAFDLIDSQGKLLSSQNIQPVARNALKDESSLFGRLSFPYVVIQGSTASYRRRLFQLGLPRFDLTFAEDNLLNFLIYAHGYRVAFLGRSMVRYRVQCDAISNRPIADEDIRVRESRSHAAVSKAINKMDAFRWIATNAGPHCPADLKEIRDRRARYLAMQEWPGLSVFGRITSILKSAGKLDFASLKWKCARVFGTVPEYQPRTWLYCVSRRLR